MTLTADQPIVLHASNDRLKHPFRAALHRESGGRPQNQLGPQCIRKLAIFSPITFVPIILTRRSPMEYSRLLCQAIVATQLPDNATSATDKRLTRDGSTLRRATVSLSLPPIPSFELSLSRSSTFRYFHKPFAVLQHTENQSSARMHCRDGTSNSSHNMQAAATTAPNLRHGMSLNHLKTARNYGCELRNIDEEEVLCDTPTKRAYRTTDRHTALGRYRGDIRVHRKTFGCNAFEWSYLYAVLS